MLVRGSAFLGAGVGCLSSFSISDRWLLAAVPFFAVVFPWRFSSPPLDKIQPGLPLSAIGISAILIADGESGNGANTEARRWEVFVLDTFGKMERRDQGEVTTAACTLTQ